MGVGRKSIVESLVSEISQSNIFQLRNCKIYELNIKGFANALSMRNFQDFSDMLDQELTKFEGSIFLVRDLEIATDDTSYEKAVTLQLIRTFILSGKVRIILTMTSTNFRKFESREQSLSNYFEIIKINEPDYETVIQILQKASIRLINYHKVNIDNTILIKAIELSKRYIQDKYLPAKAIDLLDETCTKVSIERKKDVQLSDLLSVISEKTGIPTEKISEGEKEKLLNLENELNRVIIGQNRAIHTVSEVIQRSRAGLKDPKKPIGSFLFLGPSGVGKTYLAQNLAKNIYNSEKAIIRLDMSEFSESHTVQRLIGSPPGYIGYEEGGQLTNPVWEKPYSFILLDEIEKANPKVFDIFLQILDEGRLTDSQGRTVDFKNTIIIATSNIASEEIVRITTDQNQNEFDFEKFTEDELIPVLKQYFRPEFINRFDDIVIFNPLGKEQLVKIAKLQIESISERLKDKKISINVSEEKLIEFAEKSYNPAFGARQLLRFIQDKIENVVAKKILSGEIKEGDIVNF